MPAPNSRACLLIHGFTGGPHELLPLEQALTAEGWDCRLPTLPGHDVPLSLHKVKSDDWLEAVCREAGELERLYGSFDLIGFSMGGMLAVYIAAHYKVRRLALLNAAAIYVSPGRFVKEWRLRRRLGDRTVESKIVQTPFRATWEFMKLVHRTRPQLRRVQAPTLILQSLQDPIVHPYSATYLSRKIRGETLIQLFPQSKHLLCLGPEAEEAIASVRRFLYSEEETFTSRF